MPPLLFENTESTLLIVAQALQRSYLAFQYILIDEVFLTLLEQAALLAL